MHLWCLNRAFVAWVGLLHFAWTLRSCFLIQALIEGKLHQGGFLVYLDLAFILVGNFGIDSLKAILFEKVDRTIVRIGQYLGDILVLARHLSSLIILWFDIAFESIHSNCSKTKSLVIFAYDEVYELNEARIDPFPCWLGQLLGDGMSSRVLFETTSSQEPRIWFVNGLADSIVVILRHFSWRQWIMNFTGNDDLFEVWAGQMIIDSINFNRRQIYAYVAHHVQL